VSIENTTELKVDRSKPADDLIEAINRGINNRKTRDNIDNETSSRSHVIFSIYVDGGDFKETFIDLAGAERVAKIEISPKLYLEAIFINESLEELQRVIRDLTRGVKYKYVDFTRNPLTHAISDTLGYKRSRSMLLMLINPSMYDLQDTLNTLQFGVKTGKIRAHQGLWGEVVGITRQHRLLIKNNTKDLLVVKSDSTFIAKNLTNLKEIYTMPSL